MASIKRKKSQFIVARESLGRDSHRSLGLYKCPFGDYIPIYIIYLFSSFFAQENVCGIGWSTLGGRRVKRDFISPKLAGMIQTA